MSGEWEGVGLGGERLDAGCSTLVAPFGLGLKAGLVIQ